MIMQKDEVQFGLYIKYSAITVTEIAAHTFLLNSNYKKWYAYQNVLSMSLDVSFFFTNLSNPPDLRVSWYGAQSTVHPTVFITGFKSGFYAGEASNINVVLGLFLQMIYPSYCYLIERQKGNPRHVLLTVVCIVSKAFLLHDSFFPHKIPSSGRSEALFYSW